MKEKFDFIVSVGNACSCTQILRAAGLQFLSFPFDWVIYEADDDLRRRADTIAKDFAGWFEKQDLAFRGNVDWHNKDIYVNTRTHCLFNHDFPKGAAFDDAYPLVLEKYQRRIKRLYSCIRAARRVLLVRIDRPDQQIPTPLDDCSHLLDVMAAKFPGVQFEILLLHFRAGLPFASREMSRPTPGVAELAFDYKDPDPDSASYAPDIPLVAGLLADSYEVADYRSPAEMREMRRRQKLAKYKRFGADNYLQYKFAKFRIRLMDKYHPKLVRARLRRHQYAQIVPFGVNCEVAFRFYLSWGFLDSALFAWAQTFNLGTICATLRSLDRLFAGKATLHDQSKMWKCEETGTFFHGQLKWDKGHRAYSETEIAEDLANLRGRVTHLKAKLLDYLRNDQETLLVHRLSDDDASAPDLDNRLSSLEAVLASLGAKNCKLLVVTERRHLSHMPPGPNRLFRAVAKFNPCDRVTDVDAGDTLGWKAIFSEFAPATLLPKKHAFKFE